MIKALIKTHKRIIVLNIFLSIFTIAFTQTPVHNFDSNYNTFNLSFMICGLGPNSHSMFHVFKVKGTEYFYSSKQTGFMDSSESRKEDIICGGNIRYSSIDSIIYLLKEVKDSVIYKWNMQVIDGVSHYINISNGGLTVKFNLHYETDYTAQKIVDILNSNIPDNYDKLWLYKDRKYDKWK